MSERPGIFTRLGRWLFAAPAGNQTSPQPALKALPAEASPKRGEVGVDGVAVWSGQIIAETNNELLYTEAYGRAGTRVWGEWEKFRRTDEAVAKALNFIMGPIKQARIDLVVPDKALNPQGQQQADFIRYVIDNLDPGWPEFLTQTTEMALSTGFAIHEEVWDAMEHDKLPGGKGVGIKKFAERLPSSIHFNGWITDPKTGELTAVRQNAPGHDQSWVQPEIPANKILLNTWARNGNNFQGYSAFRAVYYPLKIRRELARIIAIGHVRESLGIPIAYADAAAKPLTTEQRTSLSEFMQNCVAHENANIIMPQGWKLDWLFSKVTDKGHIIETYNALGLFVLEQLGAQQLFLGTSGTGARAVGEVHERAAAAVVTGICSHLAAVFNGVGNRDYTGFIRKLTDFNWGPQKAYVKLQMLPPKPALKLIDKMNGLSLAKAAGFITITADDENAVREDLELEPIDEATRTKAKADALEQQRAMMPPAVPASGQEGPPKKFSANEPRRALRPSEKVVDFAAIEGLFDGGREDFEQRMRPLVAKLVVKAIPDVRDAMKDGDPSEIASMPLDMSEIAAAVSKWIEELRAAGYRAVQSERIRGGGISRFAADGGAAEKKAPPPKTQKTLDALRKQVVRRMENRIRGEMEAAAGDVIRAEGDPDEVVSRVMQRQLDSGALRGEAGSVLAKSFNVGREEFAEEYASEIESVELSAYLDKNTCGPCDRLDGNEFDFNSPEHLEHVPPLSSICDGGDNCRCLLVYNWKRGAA